MQDSGRTWHIQSMSFVPMRRRSLRISIQKDTLAKLIVVSEINGVELEELIHTILEKGIEEHGFYE